jgi:hypothetical protein
VVIGESFKRFGLINNLDCLSATECIGLQSGGGAELFDPTAPSINNGRYFSVDAVGAPITGVACATQSRCDGVYRFPSLYVPATVDFAVFDAARSGSVKLLSMCSEAPTGISCPSARRCVAVTM